MPPFLRPCSGRTCDTMSAENNDTGSETDLSKYRPLEAEIISHAADGAVVDINGTQLFFQQNKHVPVLVEISVMEESAPIGGINIAKGRTVYLGGLDERLADRVDEIRELPVDEVAPALEKLAYRLNPEGREKPEGYDEEESA